MGYYFEHLLSTYTDIWYNCKPQLRKSTEEVLNQKKNDQELLKIKRIVLNYLNSPNLVSSRSLKDSSPDSFDDEATLFVKKTLLDFMHNNLYISSKTSALLDQEHYLGVTQAFIDRAYVFCPDFCFKDIYQALRNIWVIASLQIFLEVPVKLTDSIFAYSMLYPLTDNYMDDSTIETTVKKDFNQRFFEKIKQNHGNGKNDKEERIFSMIDLISSDYSREDYPHVYESLCGILDAQNKSLDQQTMTNLYDIDLLKSTFYKGGTSVLCDAYLVKGTLSDVEACFAYGYGTILQLADDLQDIDDDLKQHHMTLMNTQTTYDYLDHLFMKFTFFCNLFLEKYMPIQSEKQEALKELLQISIELLLFGGVCANKHNFSASFKRSYFKSSRFSHKKFTQFQRAMHKKISSLNMKQAANTTRF